MATVLRKKTAKKASKRKAIKDNGKIKKLVEKSEKDSIGFSKAKQLGKKTESKLS